MSIYYAAYIKLKMSLLAMKLLNIQTVKTLLNPEIYVLMISFKNILNNHYF